MPIVALVIVVILLVIALAVCAWLAAKRSALMNDCTRLQEESVQARNQNQSLTTELHSLKTQIELAGEKVRSAQQRQADIETAFSNAQKQLRDVFNGIASEALTESNRRFLELATQKFKTEQAEVGKQLELREKAIEALVNPIKETLTKYDASIKQIEEARNKAYGSITQLVAGLTEDQKNLKRETANLVQALRRPEVRGRWGEMQLRRVAELAGMIDRVDFTEQATVPGDSALRPDMIVQLPSGRTIVIDSKTPLDAFISALDCTDEDTRSTCMERHVTQIEQKVRDLSAKQYWDQFERSPEFVVLFIPGESFLAAAVERRPGLIESAMQRSVVIATPTTLISLLKTIALGWREEQIAQGAKKISELGIELHERIAVLTDHLEKLGRNLDSAVKTYNQLVGSYETRVLSSARKFKDLGADSAKALPAEGELRQIEIQPKSVVPVPMDDV